MSGLERRPLGSTGAEVSVLSYGASSLGQEFRAIDIGEVPSGSIPGRLLPLLELRLV